MEEEAPGMPIRTAEMNVPDTPPIHTASSRMKEVSLARPKVTGSSSAMANVAERPGMAPKTMPMQTMAKISSRFSGCRQVSSALKYSAIDFASFTQTGCRSAA